MDKNKTLFTLDGENFTLYDCIGAFCACAFVLAIIVLASFIDSNINF